MYHTAVDILKYNLCKELIPELEKKLFYLSDKILSFTIDANKTTMTRIHFCLDSSENMTSAVAKLIETDFKRVLYQKDKILWKSNSEKTSFHCVYDDLYDRGFIYEYGTGRVAISGPLLSLFRYLDHKILEFCIQELNAVEYQYPTMIDMQTIAKCGYIDSSPHMLFFLNYLHTDIENYEAFKKEYRQTGQTEHRFFHTTQYCLPPTMCYHTYCQLEGKTVGDAVYTARGKSFRYESKYAHGLERLWDFTIRETVFFGHYDFVMEMRKKILHFAQKLVDELQLSGYCSNASDPFFLDEDASYKMKYQKGLNSKIELRLYLDDDRTVAVGSFNLHDNFFCRNFNINMARTDEMMSGCTGFGLERFAYAFICQHGLDEKNWPIIVP